MLASRNVHEVCTLYTDGASNMKTTGLGIFLTTPSEKTIKQTIKCVPLTNNEIEFETVVTGHKLAQGLDSENMELRSDSQLVINQILNIYEAKKEQLWKYLSKVLALLSQFKE